MVRISAIIRTRDSAKTLVKCLNSLINQSFTLSSVIVVDFHSNDDTLYIAAKFGCQVIHYPNNLKFNYSIAINIGIMNTDSDLVLIISPHVWLQDPRTLGWMRDSLKSDTHIRAVSLARTSVHGLFDSQVDSPNVICISRDNFKGHAMFNYCSMIRREDWIQRAFREDIPTCEDQEWIWWWLKDGQSLAYIFSNPQVVYDNPYYNLKKDIIEYYINGKFVYPYFASIRFILSLYRKALSFARVSNLQQTKYFFYLANGLMGFKIFPPKVLHSDDYRLN
jgi:glycosyltransferase involved in cell wall biosynthesis